MLPDIIRDHKVIQQSDPNFWGLRILVRSQLNAGTWRFYWRDYFEQLLAELCEFRFPLDFNNS